VSARYESLRIARVASPLGALLAVHDAAGDLRALDFADCEPRLRRLLRGSFGPQGERPAFAPAPAGLVDSLGAFFAGDLRALDAVPLRAHGTGFQRRVWSALREIPAGATTSYGALAHALGCPSACRAVGRANGANPIAIVVPCHRVVGADGELTGYAGGLARKRWLLEHEHRWRRCA
jgi:methylated-DNA-[protein]-cysteine S-methyltransferase